MRHSGMGGDEMNLCYRKRSVLNFPQVTFLKQAEWENEGAISYVSTYGKRILGVYTDLVIAYETMLQAFLDQIGFEAYLNERTTRQTVEAFTGVINHDFFTLYGYCGRPLTSTNMEIVMLVNNVRPIVRRASKLEQQTGEKIFIDFCNTYKDLITRVDGDKALVWVATK